MPLRVGSYFITSLLMKLNLMNIMLKTLNISPTRTVLWSMSEMLHCYRNQVYVYNDYCNETSEEKLEL